MTMDKFIALLNDDLRLERKAQLAYERHAALLTGFYFAFADDLLTHAAEEHGHAIKLTDLIVLLGGSPTMEADGLIDVEQDNKAMLESDKSDENTAIERYSERIRQAREGEIFFAEFILGGILVEETHHFNDLQSILEGI
jgi:bacterioferritin